MVNDACGGRWGDSVERSYWKTKDFIPYPKIWIGEITLPGYELFRISKKSLDTAKLF
jgi:hypothetical protein